MSPCDLEQFVFLKVSIILAMEISLENCSTKMRRHFRKLEKSVQIFVQLQAEKLAGFAMMMCTIYRGLCEWKLA